MILPVQQRGGPDLRQLSLADLGRIQRSLTRRVVARDEANIVGVGFGPKRRNGQAQPGIAARFLVRHKRARVPKSRSIAPTEPVRLLDRSRRRYEEFVFATDVIEAPPPRPVGVSLQQPRNRGTTAAVMRWTSQNPVPEDLSVENFQDPRWRWGLLTVSHMFAEHDTGTAAIRRISFGADQPLSIEGRLVAAGRLPGGPDIALLETGLDRLWLSGFLPTPNTRSFATADEPDILRWIRSGLQGYAHGPGRTTAWRLELYLPEQVLPTLGRLEHLIMVAAEGPAPDRQPHFRPGTSGAVFAGAGLPAGLQIAAVAPGYDLAYAQLFLSSLPWLRQQLKARRLGIVRVF